MGMTAEEEVRATLLEWALRSHSQPDQRGALRCGLGDASAICDALVRDIEAENRGRGGKGAITKRGRELAAIAKRCGDAIWAMRERVRIKDDAP